MADADLRLVGPRDERREGDGAWRRNQAAALSAGSEWEEE